MGSIYPSDIEFNNGGLAFADGAGQIGQGLQDFGGCVGHSGGKWEGILTPRRYITI